MAAFTTKSVPQQDSPYTPPGRSKGAASRFIRGRGMISTLSSGVVLTTLGSIHPDPIDVDLERDAVEMEDIRLGLGMDLGTLSTAIGGDDGEPLPEGSSMHKFGGRPSPAPAYNKLEMGFRTIGDSPTPSLDGRQSIVGGIRVDVEQATSAR